MTDVPETVRSSPASPITREYCSALDAADPLRACRARFDLPKGVIYLDGNSLGALPRSTPARLLRIAQEEWGKGLISSWDEAGWMEAPARIGARIAPLIGAKPHEVIVADSTSVCLYKLAAAALALRPGRPAILGAEGDFPTDRYILQSLADQPGGRRDLRLVDPAAIGGILSGLSTRVAAESVALLALSHVDYRTGAMNGLAALTAKAHEAGALTLWDLSHSAGALEVDLEATGADLAVGCGYKYLNGGPGAPAFVYIAERLQAEICNAIPGWIGHADPFAFSDRYTPAAGLRRMLSGTPSILALAGLEEGVRTFDGVSMAEARVKSMRLGRLFTDLVESRAELQLASPRDPRRRGSQASFRHADAQRIIARLAGAGVIGDARPPDLMRFGFAPLYTRYVDVFEAAERLCEILAGRRA